MTKYFYPKTFLPLFASLVLLSACHSDDYPGDVLDRSLEATINEAYPGKGTASLRLPDATDFNAIPQDPKNPLSAAKVELGKNLYHETGMGSEAELAEGVYTYSCASCHHVAAGFQAGTRQGIGEGGMGFGLRGEGRKINPNYKSDEIDVQPVRTPTTLNSAYQELMLWNGQFGAVGDNIGTEANWTEGTPKAVNKLGYHGVEIQAVAGLNVHRMESDASFCEVMGYRELFDAAFPDVPAPARYDREHAGLAIAAYERTLLANEAPFQKWLGGDYNAMTEQQKRGASIFFGKAECGSCHQGPALNNMDFHALGMPDLVGSDVVSDPEDGAHKGRGGFTGNPSELYQFKTPQLYNLKDSPFFGHGGTFHSVAEVIEYKNTAIPANSNVPASQLDPTFRPLELGNQEIEDLTSFIEDALYDASLERYLPSVLPSGYCFPNNDDHSKDDLGCN
ncbi:MAG: cytochrome-c peroxidase [Bacteroidia bacterium]